MSFNRSKAWSEPQKAWRLSKPEALKSVGSRAQVCTPYWASACLTSLTLATFLQSPYSSRNPRSTAYDCAPKGQYFAILTFVNMEYLKCLLSRFSICATSNFRQEKTEKNVKNLLSQTFLGRQYSHQVFCFRTKK